MQVNVWQGAAAQLFVFAFFRIFFRLDKTGCFAGSLAIFTAGFTSIFHKLTSGFIVSGMNEKMWKMKISTRFCHRLVTIWLYNAILIRLF